MALDKVVDSTVLDTGMKSVADAIRAKAGTTDLLAWPDGFKAAVECIQTGGGSGTTSDVALKDVNFYDYDGTLVASYTLAEAQELAALPDGPTHDGLTFQGWNWSLEKIHALTHPMNVGAMYITDDGATRLKILVWDTARSNVPLYFSQTVANGVTIDWGDGSATETLAGTGNVNTTHQYTATGDYTISLAVADGCALGLGSNSLDYSVMGIITTNKNRVYCNLLQNVQIGGSVTSIGKYAFCYCYSLSSITVPDSVTSIGNSVFSNCYGMAEYHLKPTTPPTLSNNNAFQGIPSDCIIYVPAGCLEAYRNATNWATYASKMQEEPS